MALQEVQTRRDTLAGLPVGSSRCAIRVVMSDSDMVLVYEPEDKAGGRRLIFESSGAYQEVRRFPVEWRNPPEGDLLRLRRE